MLRALEAQKPLWEPGTAVAYHAVTFGHLVGELVRRITGLTLGQLIAKELVLPLGLNAWLGLPEDASVDSLSSTRCRPRPTWWHCSGSPHGTCIPMRTTDTPSFGVPPELAVVAPKMDFGLGFIAGEKLGPSSFGHPGAGGSIAFADLDARLAFAYVPNRMSADTDRATVLIDAVRTPAVALRA